MHKEVVVPSISNFFAKISKTPPVEQEEYIIDWHIHNEVELFLVTAGKREFIFKDAEIIVEQGDIIFINSRVPHKTICPLVSEGILIQFQAEMDVESEIYQKITMYWREKKRDFVYWKQEQNVELKDCIWNIYREYYEKHAAYDTFIKAYIYKILAMFYRSNILDNPSKAIDVKDMEKLIPALNYIESNYAENIRLEDIAKCIVVDKSYVCRLFKQILGVSFVEYLNYVRLYNSQKVLLETEKSVSEVAYENGFASTAYFIKVFKRYFFCTPLEYRKMYLIKHE